MKTITITIDPSGKSVIASDGFSGGECQLATKPFEEALGVRSAEKLTPEFYQQANEKAKNQSWGG